jgi:hypothetical protein
LITLALLLFASTFAYLATRTGPTSIGADGERVTSLSDAEWHTAVVLFCSTGWSFCAVFAMKAIASSSTAARALLRALQPVGLGVFFAAFLPAISGKMGQSMTLALSGFALAGLSQLLYFAFFGAKETFERVQEGIVELKDQFVQRSETRPSFLPPASFLPEGPVGGSPPPVESSPPAWTPPPTPALAPPPAWSPPPPSLAPPPAWSSPPPPPLGPPPEPGGSWQ